MIKFIIYGGNNANLYKQIDALDPTIKHVAEIKPYKSKRSIEQNKLLWDYFTEFAEHVGYEGKQEVEDLKLMVTMKLHPKIVTNPITNNIVYLPPETSKMDTKEFSEMMDKIMRYAQTLGFYRD